ncbi:hypothetical protein F3Y22_tig00110271pilonHSYRG00155 [Hibiscus syriacus]|uniref:HMG box domain-containing protein n=1 Tax=Hibiscus syriacus TaxID=106335 RepID=A0A6A3B6F7_HIBSY|nr:hypothetical protein F3Y22_tig00110271pilonHSYRG00155 [Hibiscus syriacus]
MKSKDRGIVGGEDDVEIEAEIEKQPKDGYMYFYMIECQRMKEDGEHISSVRNDVLEKWNLMSDSEKEPYIAKSKMDTVLGVGNEGKSVIEVSKSKNWKALASKYSLKQKVTYAELEEEIKSGSYGGDELKARVLLYLVGIFLCPTCDTSTNKDYMKLICDEGLKGEFNWDKYVHSRLIESIITFKKGSQRYLKGCISILEVALFDFWSGCEAVPAYERTGVIIGNEAVEVKEKEEEMVISGDDGEGMTVRETEQSRVEKTLEGVKETLERNKGEVEGKIDGLVKEVEVLRGKVVKEVEVLRGEVVKEVKVLRGELKMVTGEKIDGVVTEVVELRSELTGVKGVVDEYLDEGGKLKDADLDSECPAPQKKSQKVEKADIPSGIDDLEAAILCYDLKKSLRRIGYLPYHLAIMITINYHNSHWYLLVLDMVDRVATIYYSLFKSEATKQRVNDAKRLMKILYSYNKKRNWVEACRSLGKFPLKNFKFVEHKMNEQVNGYDYGMHVMMRMESIGSTGATSDFIVGQWDRSRILNDLRVKDVRLYQKREEMDPIGHEDDQPIGDTMMEKAPEAPIGEDVTIKTVMEYMVKFWEHIDSLVNEDEDDDEDDDDDDDDPNKYTVSTTPPARKLIIFMSMVSLPTSQDNQKVLIMFFYNFVVAIWCSNMRHNIDPVLEKLPLLSDHFLFTWDQANCKTYDNVTYCKDLNDVWNAFPYFNDLNTLLVDDSTEKMIYNLKYNYICPHSFDAASHSGDNALEKGGNIREYLENLLKAPNVPDFVRNNPFFIGLISLWVESSIFVREDDDLQMEPQRINIEENRKRPVRSSCRAKATALGKSLSAKFLVLCLEDIVNMINLDNTSYRTDFDHDCGKL